MKDDQGISESRQREKDDNEVPINSKKGYSNVDDRNKSSGSGGEPAMDRRRGSGRQGGGRDDSQHRKSGDGGGDVGAHARAQQPNKGDSTDQKDLDRRDSRDQSRRAGHGMGAGNAGTTAPSSSTMKDEKRYQQVDSRQPGGTRNHANNASSNKDRKDTKDTNNRSVAASQTRRSQSTSKHEPDPPSHKQQRSEATGSQAIQQESSSSGSILDQPDSYSLLSITGKMGILDPKKAFIGQSRVVDDFEKLNKVGEGTYGVVYRARDKKTKEIVALKRVRMERESDGLPISSLREIKLLKTLRHENVLLVKEVAVGNDLDQIFLVMEYCEQDMATLLDSIKTRYEPSEVKCLMYQLLKGIEYCHDHFVIHRDLKMSNLLFNAKGILKIADFGLARMFGTPTRPMTPKVVTLWYRAPELLFGDPYYTTAVDMWSAGCIFGELLQHSPLLPGKVEKQQVELIIDLLGTPHERIWQGFNKLPLSTVKLPEQRVNNLKNKFPNITDAALSLLNGLLTYDPKKRLTVKQALAHPYFIELPYAKHPSMLPTYPEIRNMKSVESQTQNSHSRGGAGGGRDDSNRKRPAPHEDRGGGGGRGGGGDRAQQKRPR
ncbi:Cyclin-dependent kinase 10 [Actinomortierella wolfii]|nr:Cyclin-dependent kinase 10 [Actinomortierella wolfii]